jgi:hypothetical protein
LSDSPDASRRSSEKSRQPWTLEGQGRPELSEELGRTEVDRGAARYRVAFRKAGLNLSISVLELFGYGLFSGLGS